MTSGAWRTTIVSRSAPERLELGAQARLVADEHRRRCRARATAATTPSTSTRGAASAPIASTAMRGMRWPKASGLLLFLRLDRPAGRGSSRSPRTSGGSASARRNADRERSAAPACFMTCARRIAERDLDCLLFGTAIVIVPFVSRAVVRELKLDLAERREASRPPRAASASHVQGDVVAVAAANGAEAGKPPGTAG